MEEKDLIKKLTEFRNLPSETEWLEFKEAKTSFDIDKLGQYFSALSNESNLKNVDCGWLIFGIKDSDKSIVGSNFRRDRKSLDKLKGEISSHTTYRIGFNEIYDLNLPEGRVIMFQIPKALRGIPTAWKGHFYGRDGDDTGSLSEEKKERIRKQAFEDDWSAEICPDATIEDLDPQAILKAKQNFITFSKPQLAEEATNWDDVTFLNKAKLTIKGKITRTAIILLGKTESEHFATGADLKIRWILKDSKGVEQDWQIETCPFLLAVDKIYAKIRPIRYRYMKEGTLFPDEVDRYEPFVIREAINNCIAHQDYSLGGRINVVEEEDRLIFTNSGTFIPESVEKVIQDDAPEEKYRNRFLVTAMVSLGMVETIGSGIKKMFNFQRARFFPLPEYDFSNNRVKVTIIGKVLDMDYAQVLAQDNDLSLEEIMMLDKVQKRKPLTNYEIKHLKGKGLIEGVKPNYFISAKVAQKTGQKAAYTKFKGFENSYYQDLIIKALTDHHNLTRKDFDELIWDKLPDWMDDRQKKTKITNLLADLRHKNKIKNTGSDFKPNWVLVKHK